MPEAKLGNFIDGVPRRIQHNAVQILKRNGVQRTDARHYQVHGIRGAIVTVAKVDDNWRCRTCGTRQGHPCAHVVAVCMALEHERAANNPGRGKRKRDWKTLTNAKCQTPRKFPRLAKRLVATIEEPPYCGRGKPRLPRADLVYSALVYAYAKSGLRETQGVLRQDPFLKHLGATCSFASICGFLNHEDTRPLLERLLLISAAPAAPFEDTVLVDGTGFSVRRFFGYNHARHRGGEVRTHKWAKPVISCMADSKVIPAMQVLDSDDGECPWLLPLLERVRSVFHLSTVCADRAYVKMLHYEWGKRRGIDMMIPPRQNAKAQVRQTKGSRAYRDAVHQWLVDPVGQGDKYHQRSAVESLMQTLKQVFGDKLRCRNPRAQRNELLCRAIVHNLRQLIVLIEDRGLVIDFESWAHVVGKEPWTGLAEWHERYMGDNAFQYARAAA